MSTHRAARLAGVALALAALAGCATPEARLRTGLIDAGLSTRMATCMAGRMVDRLSLGQLMKIGKLKSIGGKPAGDISWNDFLARTRALQDPEILSVTLSSGAVCLIDRT